MFIYASRCVFTDWQGSGSVTCCYHETAMETEARDPLQGIFSVIAVAERNSRKPDPFDGVKGLHHLKLARTVTRDNLVSKAYCHRRTRLENRSSIANAGYSRHQGCVRCKPISDALILR